MFDISPSTCTLYLGDCLKVMSFLKPHIVNMTFADLPYQCTSMAWDVGIDLHNFWASLNCISKPNGIHVATGIQPFSSSLISSNAASFKYELIWAKNRGSGHLQANKRPMRAHENILIFSNKRGTYNAQKTYGHGPVRSGTRKSENIFYGSDTVKSQRGATSRFPLSVLNIASDNKIRGKAKGAMIVLHPTQKPVALLEWLIKTYSNEGDTVLDPVFGSNTTGVACARLGRNYIGIEKAPEYFRIGTERVNAERAKLGLKPCEVKI